MNNESRNLRQRKKDFVAEDSEAVVNSPMPFREKVKYLTTEITTTRPSSSKYFKRKLFCRFALGPLLGVLFTLFFLKSFLDSDRVEFLKLIFDNDLLKILPNSLANDIVANITNIFRQQEPSLEDLIPGKSLNALGASAKFPVFIIPGITSSGLELWKGQECAEPYFRKRLWGTTSMIRLILTDKQCWLNHMKLNITDGLDPADIKLRAAQGLEAADFLIPGYWVWAKIIENLAEVGYDHSSLFLASYDWRLAFEDLEIRDQYFSRLKAQIEFHHKVFNEKIVLLSHSMGSNLVFYFMKWVESSKGGKGGSKWIEKHIEHFINIAGPLLGAPKSLSAALSGETRDTAQLGQVESAVLEFFFSREERAEVFRMYGGILGLLPKGGNLLWGDGKSSVDESIPHMIILNEETNRQNLTTEQALNLTLSCLPKPSYDRFNRQFSMGYDPYAPDEPKYWTNPLESKLPLAPSMKISCFYGVNKPTERAFIYQPNEPQNGKNNISIPFIVSKSFESDNNNPLKYASGVFLEDGDGTVPVLSNGFMCRHGWKSKLFNPSGVSIHTREYVHEPVSLVSDIRGGPKTSDHVDILGNHHLITDILKIVTGYEIPDDKIHSKIDTFNSTFLHK
ncbi:Lecithin:cholesterol/phospholipid:diacylglycerol acyltransferase-like protein [Rozella allomycis CSF55]|uniref:Lecithin:cholesterol/phospholipid:diacylglycerol acyltransferase-like protein n=1 Tax=Rozella allomycis (strain CSF55) TaxID=988480 RepID=A0A075B0Z5_ROZAC|nr:Lecithin:cholesterol/phospholipid:diacylglycerol acyltransferase-like protein [Rozella allomycis CSF55]|eukprot:EPZ34601.1 Lecithin:cholesterol/phospholipid:diacylglycerol acyltransferase-like protein [Rozella allomycis CSF55]